MFIDEPELVTVRAWLDPQVRRFAARVRSNIQTHRVHPTFNTKTSMRKDVIALGTVWSLLQEADGYRRSDESAISSDTRERVEAAFGEALDYGLV